MHFKHGIFVELKHKTTNNRRYVKARSSGGPWATAHSAHSLAHNAALERVAHHHCLV